MMRRPSVPLCFMVAVLASVSQSMAGGMERASVSSSGKQIYQNNDLPGISASGDIVTYFSSAKHLVIGDTNETFDVFAYNRAGNITRRISLSTAGTQANDISYEGRVSGNGRFVAFTSLASNLVPHDYNRESDIFVRDRRTGVTQRVSVASNGAESDGTSYSPSISYDGRFVAFLSTAANLVKRDSNGVADAFVHDRTTGKTQRVSVGPKGAESNDESRSVAISGDGLRIAFQSYAGNLVEGDGNGAEDVFVYDRPTARTLRVSVGTGGTEANDGSVNPSLDYYGRFAAFQSFANNLAPRDSNDAEDIFVHDLKTGGTERVSVNSHGQQSGLYLGSTRAAISGDGRFVVFQSIATNFTAHDGNNEPDIFVHDRKNGKTRRVSTALDGGDPNSYSANPAINGDGSVIAFESRASNLVANDSNGRRDIFVMDRRGMRPANRDETRGAWR